MYFIEIKNRLLLAIMTWVICLITNYVYLDNLLYITIKPCLYECNKDFYFIFTDISEPFYANINLILYASNQILYIIFYYQIVSFLKPGLYGNEYKYVKYFSIYGCVLFLIYFKICYTLIIPWSFFFFFLHNKTQKIEFFFEAKMNEYLEIIFSAYKISIIFAIVCILFIGGLINSKNIKSLTLVYRKYCYIIILLLVSIVTPPDIFSQLSITIIIIIIFEIIIYAILFVYRLKLLYNLRKPIKTNKNSYSKNQIS